MPRPGHVISQCEDGLLIFWCPGCKEYHGIWVVQPNPVTGAKWSWNHDFVRPSVQPSLHIRRNAADPAAPTCHLWMNEGRLEYLSDCSHELAGKTVAMEAEG